MTLGHKLKALRSEKGLTQKDLADQLHVSFQTVSKWENDENEPDINTLKELAKLYDCSIDDLLNEEEKQVTVKEEKKEEIKPVPQTIVVHQKELHVCEVCKKDIPEDDLEMEQICVSRPTRGTPIYRPAYYHRKCFDQLKFERRKEENRIQKANTSKAKKFSIGFGIFGGIVALGISLGVFLGVEYFQQNLHPGLAVLFAFLIGLTIFADIYCIISGSYIADVFTSVAGWSIKFPGLIFTWSVEGVKWLIAMKILFVVLGALVTVATLVLAVVLSAALSVVSFPFVLIHNIRTGYSESMTN